MPKLTEFLLKLATDHHELKKYRTMMEDKDAKAKLREYLTGKPYPGLTHKQAEAVEGHSSVAVVEAVLEELTKESSRPGNPFYGIAVTFMCEVNNHVQIHHLTE